MISRLIDRVTLWLRPDLGEREGVSQTSQRLNVYIVLLGYSIGIAALVWLVAETDLAVLRDNAGFLLLLLFLGALFSRYPFQIQIELRPGVIATSGGTVYFLVVVCALLVFGPSALWLGVLVPLVRELVNYFREPTRDGRWGIMATFGANIGTGPLSWLAGYRVYQFFGGPTPLDALSLQMIWPAAAFMLVYWLLPFVVMLPIFIYLTGEPDLVGEEAGERGKLLFFLFFNSSVPNLAVPFAFLGAALYSLAGPAYMVFFLLGLLLSSMLANNLTNSVTARNQRARELGILEALGRDIITAAPDGSDLAEIVSRYASPMFIGGRLCIWLEDGRVLYQSQFPLPPLEDMRAALPEAPEPVHLPPDGELVTDSSRSAAVLPIRADDGKLLGGIYFDISRGTGSPPDYIPALQSLAAQIASAIYRTEAYQAALQKERMENELTLAGRIQANFLPGVIPALAGYEIAASLDPALQTSGDFYDFIPFPDGRLGFIIADVADKGTGAALFMALTRTLLRTYALERPDAPAEVFRLVNDRVHEDTQAQLFITTFYGIIDPELHTLTYVNGGHNPPYLFQPGRDEPLGLIRTGIPIGMLDEGEWRAETIGFPPGASLVLYTDGVTEAQNTAEEFFEEERLQTAVNGSLEDSAAGMHARVLEAIHTFTAGAAQFDDITLMVIRRRHTETA